jgi:hypothetical protein
VTGAADDGYLPRVEEIVFAAKMVGKVVIFFDMPKTASMGDFMGHAFGLAAFDGDVIGEWTQGTANVSPLHFLYNVNDNGGGIANDALEDGVETFGIGGVFKIGSACPDIVDSGSAAA